MKKPIILYTTIIHPGEILNFVKHNSSLDEDILFNDLKSELSFDESGIMPILVDYKWKYGFWINKFIEAYRLQNNFYISKNY